MVTATSISGETPIPRQNIYKIREEYKDHNIMMTIWDSTNGGLNKDYMAHKTIPEVQANMGIPSGVGGSYIAIAI